MAAPWSEGLSAELQSSSTKALAVVEHVAATLPGGFVGYVPTSAQPAVLANGNPWALVTEDNGVKARPRREPNAAVLRGLAAHPRAQVYGRKVDGGPPYAVGVAHFSQPAEAVADFLFQPANMHRWNDELCEKGEARAGPPLCSLCPLVALQRREQSARGRWTSHLASPLPPPQLLRQLNPDAALGHLIYYGETALGITVVSTRVRSPSSPPLPHSSALTPSLAFILSEPDHPHGPGETGRGRNSDRLRVGGRLDGPAAPQGDGARAAALGRGHHQALCRRRV
jgi:hypothetical protein